MKKRIFYIIGLPIVVAIIAVMACTKDANEVNAVNTKTEDVLTVATYSYWGQLHNEGLTNFNDNFKIPEGNFSLSEKIEYIKNFNIDFLEKSDITQFCTRKDVKLQMDKSKNLVDKRYLYNKCFTPAMQLQSSYSSLQDADSINIYDALDIAFKNDFIDEFEYSSMKEILDYAKENLDSLATQPKDFTALLDNLRIKYNSKKYPADGKYGNYLGFVLAIGDASNDWWTSNQDALIGIGNSTEPINQLQAGPLGDALGAIKGVGGYLLGCLVSGDGASFKGGFVAGFAGALEGSTGILGKVWSWFTDLF